MTPRKVAFFLSLLAVILFAVNATSAEPEPATKVEKGCLTCHAPFAEMKGVLAGNVSAKSLKGKTLQLKIDDKQELVNYNADTKLENVPDLDSLQNGMSVRVHYKMDGGVRVATSVVVKPKIKVPEEQLIGVEDLAKLLEKGGVTLVDSRPPDGYASGHIPTAINIPLPKMKESVDKLPTDKNAPVVFYCLGFR